MKAYHFVSDTLRDGRPIPPDGEWLTHDGPCVMCKSGLHASRHPSDALKYAPGATLCLVECEDIVEEEKDKLVCRRRKIVKRLDATKLLRDFARSQARKVMYLWAAPPVVKDYLQTGDESLRAAAHYAAGNTTYGVTRCAVWVTARRAALAATCDVAWVTAWAVACDAVWYAARCAAYYAARDAEYYAAMAAARDEFAACVDAAVGAEDRLPNETKQSGSLHGEMPVGPACSLR